MTVELRAQLEQAARWISAADALLVSAGAGMGVDSGLPDFRGPQGFWRAYPALARAGLRFEEIADPRHFAGDPHLAWGFYGHRLALYRRTQPHAGFGLLQRWAAAMPGGLFVFTSNVDGQFQKAGVLAERVCEVHGSIHELQCSVPCHADTWPARELQPQIDEDACRWLGELPRCPRCGAVARPNILMFGDADWLAQRADAQAAGLQRWLAAAAAPVVIECGSGTAIPSARRMSELVARTRGAPLVRINPRESDVPGVLRGVGLPLGAADELAQIDAALRR